MSLSVLMSVYNKEKPEYLIACLQSLLEQILKADEVVLVEDGPISPELKGVIERFRQPLNIISVSLAENVGLACALNEGLKYCSYDLVARMDTDDIALPERFKIQLEYMQNNNIDMCGSNAFLINSNGDIVGKKIVLGEVTFSSLLKNCDVIHPSTMFTKEFFTKFGSYNSEFKKSQDYELWVRASKSGAKIKNIDKPLLHFRISDDLVKRRKDEQKYNMIIKRKYVSGLKYYISILPNMLIFILPVFILDILLKIKSK